MRNFNAIRTIDLKEYLPEVLKDVREMQAIMDAETPEIQAIWQACEDCMNDQFITEATENGIARREKKLGITPFATDTLEDRRFRLLSYYGTDIPYTRRSLAAMLESLCGSDGYVLSINTAAFNVNVQLAFGTRKQVAIVAEMLERVLPYNMVLAVEQFFESSADVIYGVACEMSSRIDIYPRTSRAITTEGIAAVAGAGVYNSTLEIYPQGGESQ